MITPLLVPPFCSSEENQRSLRDSICDNVDLRRKSTKKKRYTRVRCHPMSNLGWDLASFALLLKLMVASSNSFNLPKPPSNSFKSFFKARCRLCFASGEIFSFKKRYSWCIYFPWIAVHSFILSSSYHRHLDPLTILVPLKEYIHYPDKYTFCCIKYLPYIPHQHIGPSLTFSFCWLKTDVSLLYLIYFKMDTERNQNCCKFLFKISTVPIVQQLLFWQ